MRQAAVMILGALPLLAGCAESDSTGGWTGPGAGDPPVIMGFDRGLPAGLRPAPRLRSPVAAILGPGRLGLTTWGSSSCPTTPVRVNETGSGVLRVVLGDYAADPDEVCSADLGPTTSRIGVDPALTRGGRMDLIVVYPESRKHVRVVAGPLRDG